MRTTLKATARRALNDALAEVVPTLPLDSIPLGGIFEAFEGRGVLVLQEDGTRWAGLLCGREGRVTFDLGPEEGRVFSNAALVLMWHKFDTGRYEVVAYVS